LQELLCLIQNPQSKIDVLHVATSSGRWAPFCRQILDFLKADPIDLVIDGARMRGLWSPDSPAER